MVRPAHTRVRGAALALGALAFSSWAISARATDDDHAACRVSVEISPATAWVGQQLLYRVRIVRREDVENVEWVLPPTFPGFRAEWLPGRAEDTEMHFQGVRYLAREQHRALFPARAGNQRIQGASLRCRVSRRGPRAAQALIVAVPDATLRVLEPPEAGRPAGYSGVIGPIWVRTIVSPEVVHLGGSVSVSIGVRGNTNVWAAAPPIEGDSAIPGAEIFASPPSLDMEGGESLHVRRFFRYEVVPLREGRLAIPEVRIPYYDPAAGRYAFAEAAGVDVSVLPRLPTPPPRAQKPRGSDAAAPASPTADGFPWLASLVGVAALVGVGALTARRAGSRRPWKRVDAALAEATTAADRGDPVEETAALARALRTAVALAHPELASCDPEALRSRTDDAELAEVASLLEALDWIRYAGELGHPDREAICDAIETLRGRFASTARR